jgi:transposase
MDYHQNARLTVVSREQMCRKVVEQGLTLKRAAASFNVSPKTAAKWVRRYREAACPTPLFSPWASLANKKPRP